MRLRGFGKVTFQGLSWQPPARAITILASHQPARDIIAITFAGFAGMGRRKPISRLIIEPAGQRR